MIVSIEHGVLYVDNLQFSLAGAGNERTDLPPGRYPIEARVSHNHGAVIPHADGIGWLGFAPDCAIVLGKVRASSGVLPDRATVQRLVACIRAETDADRPVLMEIK